MSDTDVANPPAKNAQVRGRGTPALITASRPGRDGGEHGLIVFDFDNTLVHSKIDFQGIRRDLLDLLRRAGVPEAVDERLARLSIGQIIETGEAHDPATGPVAWRIVLDYETAGMEASTIEEGAAATLHALRDDGFRLAVLTNNARPATLAALEKFDLRPAFDLILTRDEVPMKPDPAGIVQARGALGPSGRAVVVGDSWLDGAAAQRAVVPFVAFRPRSGVLDERGVPYWTVIERLSDLPPLLAGPWPGVGEP
ncbi:MAG: HAD family hydrolase [Chloroflexi bacterium]|nr:HAD family hydrolase [Chloroflexota bacterium]